MAGSIPGARNSSSEFLLADVMATRKTTLQVRKHNVADLSGSKGLSVRAFKTFDKSQVGYLCTTGGFKFVASLINLYTVGCCERAPRDPCDKTDNNTATCLRMVLSVPCPVRPGETPDFLYKPCFLVGSVQYN